MKGRTALAWLLLLAPLAGAQGHAHHAAEGGAAVDAVVLLDVQDPTVRAGDPARFEAIVFGGDPVPDAAQDLRVEVLFAERVLFATTAASGQDADGVAHFDVVFPSPGPFTVRALDADGRERARFDGWAIPADLQPATAHLEGPSAAVVGQPALFRSWAEDAGGRQVQHFYTLFEVRRDGQLVYRAKLHGHAEADLGPNEVEVGFPAPGAYTVDATVFQASPYGPQHIAFAPMRASQTVLVAAGAPALPAPTAALPPASREPIVTADGAEVSLTGTYDPAPQVAPGVLQRLGVLAHGATGGLLTHDDFKVRLVGPLGQTLFASRFLHESDGVLELATTQTLPGTYNLEVQQADAASITLPFDLLPPTSEPAQLAAGGPFQVRVDGFAGLQAGVPAGVELAIADAAGTPLAQADADIQVVGPDGVPIVTATLHADAAGRLPFAFTPLQAGPHVLRVAPSALDGRAAAFTGDALAGLAADAAPGEAWPVVLRPPEPADESTGGSAAAPALPSAAAVLTAGLVATAFWAWRRRR